MKVKRLCSVVMLTALLCVVAFLCSQGFLRNLHVLLAFDETFSAIFEQISDAHISPPVLLGFAVSFASSLWMVSLWEQGRRKALAVLWGSFTLLILTVGNVLLSRVNGIRFCDVLFSLLDVMQKGGLG